MLDAMAPRPVKAVDVVLWREGWHPPQRAGRADGARKRACVDNFEGTGDKRRQRPIRRRPLSQFAHLQTNLGTHPQACGQTEQLSACVIYRETETRSTVARHDLSRPRHSYISASVPHPFGRREIQIFAVSRKTQREEGRSYQTRRLLARLMLSVRRTSTSHV